MAENYEYVKNNGRESGYICVDIKHKLLYIFIYVHVCAYACITLYKLYTHLTPVCSIRVFLQLCGCAAAAASLTADTQAMCRSPVGTVLPCPGGVPRDRAPEDTRGADTHSTCLPPLPACRTPSAGA